MLQQKLTEETTVSLPTVMSAQQTETISEGQNTHTLTNGVQTAIEVEGTSAETVITPTTSLQEEGISTTTIETTLANLDRQWELCEGLKMTYFNLKWVSVFLTVVSFALYRSHEDLMAHLRAIDSQEALPTDSRLMIPLMLAVICWVLTPIIGWLRNRSQHKRDALMHYIVQLDDLRVVRPLARALDVRSDGLRSTVLATLNRLLPLQTDDTRVVGPLIDTLSSLETLFCYDRTLRAKIISMLVQLLPRMSRADADRLQENQRNRLNYYLWRLTPTLREGDDPTSFVLSLKIAFGLREGYLRGDEKGLVLAIIKAYPVIGDGTELSQVRHVAKGHYKTGADADVRQAAQKYLDLIEQRKKQEQLPTTLLRASSSSEIGTDTLLRAAHDSPTSSPDELLRPTTVEDATNQGTDISQTSCHDE